MRARGHSFALLLALVAAPALAGPQGPHTAGTKGGPHAATVGPAIVAVAIAAGGPNWCSAMLACWYMEEASGNRANSQGNASRALVQNGGTIPNNTTQKMQGTASADLTASVTFHVADTALAQLGPPLACGFWARPTGAGNEDVLRTAIETTSGGFIPYWGGDFVWRVNDLGHAQTLAGSPSTAASTWAHIVVVGSATATQLYINGVLGGSTATILLAPNTSGATMDVGHGNNFFGPGQLDEVWCGTTALSATSVCRICSCGLDGSLCQCSGPSYTTTGRNTASCGSCALPANCSAAAPS